MQRKGGTSLLAALRSLLQAGLRLWHAPAVGVCVHPSIEGGNVHGDPAVQPHRFERKHLCTKQILDMSRGESGSKCNGGGVFCCGYSEDPTEGQGKDHQWGHIPALLFKLRCQAVDAVQIMLV